MAWGCRLAIVESTEEVGRATTAEPNNSPSCAILYVWLLDTMVPVAEDCEGVL